LRYVRSLLLFYVVLCSNATAQNLPKGLSVSEGKQNDCGGKHQPGDRLTCRVVFDGKSEFTKVEVVFNLQTEKDADQIGMFINFVLRDSQKVGNQIYEVSGVLPPQNASGVYLLSAVSASMGERGYRLYQNGYGFKSDITFDFRNPASSVVKTVEPDNQTILGPATNIEIKPETEEEVRKRFPPLVGISENAPTSSSSRGPSAWFHHNFKQESCGGSHKPGERLTCYISFEQDAAFYSIFVNFNRLTEIPKDQLGLCGSFLLQVTQKVDFRTYKITGVLPACAAGRYYISDVSARSADGGMHLYNCRALLKSDTTVDLRNSHQKLFPDVKNVSSN
jgi:hypothetical protein